MSTLRVVAMRSWRSKKFASAPEMANRYQNVHLPTRYDQFYSDESIIFYVLVAAAKLRKKRPQSFHDSIPTTNTTPMSRQEKLVLADGMRRILREEGADNRVELPSSRGPHHRSWERKSTAAR